MEKPSDPSRPPQVSWIIAASCGTCRTCGWRASTSPTRLCASSASRCLRCPAWTWATATTSTTSRSTSWQRLGPPPGTRSQRSTCQVRAGGWALRPHPRQTKPFSVCPALLFKHCGRRWMEMTQLLLYPSVLSCNIAMQVNMISFPLQKCETHEWPWKRLGPEAMRGSSSIDPITHKRGTISTGNKQP